MSEIRAKRSPIRLDARAYRELCKEVLERDGRRCQSCGSLSAVEVHHQRFRSHQGADAKSNLITLCCKCHREIHEHAK
jgi:5-methylcytosine-specific restriction endonuclease McrA